MKAIPTLREQRRDLKPIRRARSHTLSGAHVTTAASRTLTFPIHSHGHESPAHANQRRSLACSESRVAFGVAFALWSAALGGLSYGWCGMPRRCELKSLMAALRRRATTPPSGGSRGSRPLLGSLERSRRSGKLAAASRARLCSDPTGPPAAGCAHR